MREIFENESAWLTEWNRIIEQRRKLKHCRRCLYSELTPSIQFDQTGVCNYCQIHDQLEKEYQTGEAGRRKLEQIAKAIATAGRNKPYDVIVGVSGGTDSSYLLHLSRELGLRPLAVHFDNTWNSTIAVENIHRVLKKLEIELWTYVVDNREYDDLYRSFLKAGTIDLEIPTDIGLATVLNMAAERYGIRYIFEGHSYRTEGISPLGWLYMDARYIADVQRRYGTVSLKTFPNLWLSSQLRWMVLKGIKRIRPLWYIQYIKSDVQEMLTREYAWQWYGGHHLENRITAFFHSYFLPRRFGIDMRVLGHSALVRSRQLERAAALEQLEEPPHCPSELLEMVKKRLKLSDQEFVSLMTLPVQTYRDFKSYKKVFERFRLFFYALAKLDLIPMSFYLKYTSKDNLQLLKGSKPIFPLTQFCTSPVSTHESDD